MSRDLYEVLGVARDAADVEIRRAFRQAARRVHPDVAGDDADARAQWLELREAQEVLLDGAKRLAYDRRVFGGWPAPRTDRGRATDGRPRPWRRQVDEGPPTAPPDPPRRAERTERPRGRPPGSPTRPSGPSIDGSDVTLDVEVPFRMARDGGRVTVTHPRREPAGPTREHQTELHVPEGVRHLEVRRYDGMGDPGAGGGRDGDLVVRFFLVDDPVDDTTGDPPSTTVDMSRRDVAIELLVTEAMLGVVRTVETPRGPVRIRVPAGTSHGTKFRLRARGPERPDGLRDDWVIEVKVRVPAVGPDHPLRAAVEALGDQLASDDSAAE